MTSNHEAQALYNEAAYILKQNAERRYAARRHLWETELSIWIEEAARSGKDHILLTKDCHDHIQRYVNPMVLQQYTITEHRSWGEPLHYRLYWKEPAFYPEPTWLDRFHNWWSGVFPKRNQAPF